MFIKRLLSISFSCLALLACRTTKQRIAVAQSATTVPATVLQPYGPAWAALWQQQAGEYKALCLQAYQIAALRMDEYVQQPHGKPLAVVTDIDETVLDNSPNTVHQSLQGKGYTQADWEAWTARAAADTVPGAPAFFKYAVSKGVDVYYITNRDESERAATLQNLRRWGFPQATDDHLVLRGTTSSKESRRQALALTHDIVMLVGDNLSDFSAAFDKQLPAARLQAVHNNAAEFGKRFIVLPNPMYGDWETALYHFQHQLSIPQKDSILRSSLRNY